MIRQVLPSKQVGETILVAFHFQSVLAAGVTISTPTVTATVFSGVDATPSGILSGVASISGTDVDQKLTAGVAGTIYDVVAQAVSSDGQTIQVGGFLAVVALP